MIMSTILRLLLFLAIFALTALFNIIQIDVRFEEIRYLLGTIASTDEMSNTFGIVARYELIKRRMQYGEENQENYELEARMQALSSQSIQTDTLGQAKYHIVRVPVTLALNGIRYLLGKPIINPKAEDKIFTVLEIGYFYERVRKYTEALKYYDEILGAGQLTPDIRAAILVHKSFCMSMIGRYEQSKKLYEQVINEFPNTEAGILSWKLLDFLNSMETERAVLSEKKISGMEKAKQFYMLMDFRNAIKNYSVFLSDKHDKQSVAEARFYKGRSHEELGETEDALMEYRAVIRMDTTKVWAKQANRRMLMLGEFYEQQKTVAEEARHKLELYQDQVFAKNVEKYAPLVSATKLKGELSSAGASSVYASNDSILNMIDKIGVEEPSPGQREKTLKNEKLNKELLANGTLNSAEIKELNRRQYLAENPYRRPSALKEHIDNYSAELRYLYNKRLRSGVKLSGNMLLEIKIQPSGTVSDVKVLQSNMGDVLFEKSITSTVGKWKFKAVPDSLGDLTINYPFEFYEEQ